MEFRPIELEHLDFDRLWEGAAFCGGAIAPGEDAGVSSRLHVSPLDVEDEVFILLGATHDADLADFFAMADEQAIFDTPCFGRRVDIDPAGEVFAVKK